MATMVPNRQQRLRPRNLRARIHLLFRSMQARRRHME